MNTVFTFQHRFHLHLCFTFILFQDYDSSHRVCVPWSIPSSFYLAHYQNVVLEAATPKM